MSDVGPSPAGMGPPEENRDAPSVAARFLQGRYTALALALLFLAAAYPVLSWGVFGLGLWTVASWAVLMGALHAVGMGRRMRRLARFLAFMAFIAGLAGIACFQLRGTQHAWIFAVIDGLTFAFLALATGAILKNVLTSKAHDGDHLLGAACVYVLLGSTFAHALPVIDLFTPTPILSSLGPVELQAGGDPGLVRAEHLYFSFVTLSTLGYGDLVPATLVMRLVASVEAILGQLFLAILVARLIGLHISNDFPGERRG